MRTLIFFLLDVDWETTPQGPQIRLWGVDDRGNDVVLVDRSYKPYFHAIPKQGVSGDALCEALSSLKAESGHDLTTSVEDKKLFSRTIEAVKVSLGSPEMAQAIARRVAKHPLVEDVLGDDIRYSTSYLLDMGFVPCRWHDCNVEECNLEEAQVDDAYILFDSPRMSSAENTPDLRILAFLPIAFAEYGSAHAAQDPVSIISVATTDGRARSFTRSNESDLEVIREFAEFLTEFDPHIVAGFGSNSIHWPYLIERSKKLGLSLAVSRVGSQPHTSVYGHISITGRASVDMLDYAEELPGVKVKTLENAAAFLRIETKSSLPDELEFPRIWNAPAERHLLVGCAEARSAAILEMTRRFLEFGIGLSSLTSMPLDQVATASVGHRVDSYLMREACKQGHLIPHRGEELYTKYKGAIVLAPRKGLHDNVVALDFASMYPNLMILYNLSPDTFVPPIEEIELEQCYVIDDLEHKFRKSPPGLFKNALLGLLSSRRDVNKKLRDESLSEDQRRVLRERERAVKVIANACYGYSGWTGARWYAREVAESAAALGRKSIMQVIDRCKGIDLPIVYADTDAVFVTNDENKVTSLLGWVSETLHMDIRPDKTYSRVLFTEAKKRYAGLLVDGTLDIVGMEAVRGDWSEIAREVQEKVIELVLREASADKAKLYVLNAIDDLRAGKVAMRDLVIWKSLTKPLEDYKVKAPHVEVAKKYLSRGRELLPGDKIGYIVTKTGRKLYEKAQPYFAVTADQVDLEYYVSSQVVPAAARILEVFNVREDQLLSARNWTLTDSLTD